MRERDRGGIERNIEREKEREGVKVKYMALLREREET